MGAEKQQSVQHFITLLACLAAVWRRGSCSDQFPSVGITYLESAKSSGAVCLDGTVPAYHLLPGCNESWHIFLEGGGWCESEAACAMRAKTSLGSSTYMQSPALFNGILNNNAQANSEFSNWTHVYVRYCDGASFSADIDAPRVLASGQVLYFRGKRIFKAIIEELMSKGLNQAKQALLTGCSAGGLAAIHRCNQFQSLLSPRKVKCLSDGGFFLNVSDVNGSFAMSNYYSGVVDVHGLNNTLESSCLASNSPAQCFFPQTMQAYVEPPLFILNAAYDYWQLEHVKKLPRDEYIGCMNSSSCPAEATMQEFRQRMVEALEQAPSSESMFIDSCFTHCQSRGDQRWNTPELDGKFLAGTVADWFYDRVPQSRHIDCPYPCNPTCVPGLD